ARIGRSAWVSEFEKACRSQAAVEAGKDNRTLFENGRRQVLRPIVLDALHRITALTDERRANAKLTHKRRRPCPTGDEEGVSVELFARLGNDAAACIEGSDAIGDGHSAKRCKLRQDAVTRALGIADLTGAVEVQPARRTLAQHRVITRKFIG